MRVFCPPAEFWGPATTTAEDTLLTIYLSAGPIPLPTHPHPASDMSAANGYALGFDANGADPSPQPTRSESDLSDVNDISTTLPTESRQDENAASEDDAMHDMATSDEGDSADAAGEEDADFDEEAPSPEPASGMRHDRSGSDDSQRSSKRKAGEVDDDEYMKQNPELYGLRRSVRISPARQTHHITDAVPLGSGTPES